MGRGRVMGRGSAESRLRGMGRGSVGAWLRGMGRGSAGEEFRGMGSRTDTMTKEFFQVIGPLWMVSLYPNTSFHGRITEFCLKKFFRSKGYGW